MAMRLLASVAKAFVSTGGRGHSTPEGQLTNSQKRKKQKSSPNVGDGWMDTWPEMRTCL